MQGIADSFDEELNILRGFIDFINNQVGVYMDCVSGFRGNTIRIERQVHRVQRPTGRAINNGVPVMMYASLEDPSMPDVIHHRILRADHFLSANGESGFNHQQICWSIIVFIFAYWDEEVRPQIARARKLPAGQVRVDVMGDLRLIRNSIIHNKGVVALSDHGRLKQMAQLVRPDKKISITYDQMHQVFVLVKKAIAEIILAHTSHLPGAPDPSKVAEVAIMNMPGCRDN